jgi:hypothetical protein
MTIIAAWNFDNALEGTTVYDDVGAHNGSVVGSVPLVVGPISYKSRLFPGGNNKLVIPHHANFTATTHKIYEIWFSTPSSLSTSYRYLLMKTPSSGNKVQVSLSLLNPDVTRIQFSVRDNSANEASSISPTTTIFASRLYYIVGTWNPTTKTTQLFINGVCVAEATNNSIDIGQIDVTDDMGIGGGGTYTGFEWKGLIHSVRISDIITTIPKRIFDTYMASNIQES